MIGRQRLLSVALVAGVAVTSMLIYTGSDPDLEIALTAENSDLTELDPLKTSPATAIPAPELDAFSEIVERPLHAPGNRRLSPMQIQPRQTFPAVQFKRISFWSWGSSSPGKRNWRC